RRVATAARLARRHHHVRGPNMSRTLLRPAQRLVVAALLAVSAAPAAAQSASPNAQPNAQPTAQPNAQPKADTLSARKLNLEVEKLQAEVKELQATNDALGARTRTVTAWASAIGGTVA